MSPEIDYLKEELDKVKQQISAYEQENDLLQKLITQNKGFNMDKIAKSAQFLIGLLVLVVGMGISWGVANAKLANVEKNNIAITALTGKIQQIEITESRTDVILKDIRDDLSDIKTDIKTLLTKGAKK